MSFNFKIFALLLAVALIAGCSSEAKKEGFEKKRNYTDQIRYAGEDSLRLININGSITLKAVTRAEFVTIDAVISASGQNDEDAQSFLDQIKIDFKKMEGELKTETIVPKVWTMPGSAKKPTDFYVDMVVEIPDGLSVECTNTNGNVNITGPHLDINTVLENGNITVTGTYGKIHVSTINGEISIRNDQEYGLDIQAVSKDGNLILDLPAAQTGKFELRSLRGSIDCQMPAVFEPEMVLETTVGDITMLMGRRLAATVELQTEKGKITSNMVINSSVAGGKITDSYVKGMIGSGIGKINGKVKQGNIKLNYPEGVE